MSRGTRRGVVLLIRSLDIGGAERQLVELAKGLQWLGVVVQVITFYPGGALRAELEVAGIAVDDLGKRRRWEVLLLLFRLWRRLRLTHPAALYCFMPASNILGALMKPFMPAMRLAWGVRASGLDLDCYDRLTGWVQKLESMLAWIPDAIIANSQAGLADCVARDFPKTRLEAIPNGVDVLRFQFDSAGRDRLRREWGIPQGAMLIGIAARLDPMKGYETFLAAAAMLARNFPAVRFVCVGGGAADYLQILRASTAASLVERVFWAGSRQDMSAVYSAFDIFTSASIFGEGFSNALAEAMACERLCVATDVGDSAIILEAIGGIVPPGDAERLMQAWVEALALPAEVRHESGRAARARVIERYSVETMARSVCRTLQLEPG